MIITAYAFMAMLDAIQLAAIRPILIPIYRLRVVMAEYRLKSNSLVDPGPAPGSGRAGDSLRTRHGARA